MTFDVSITRGDADDRIARRTKRARKKEKSRARRVRRASSSERDSDNPAVNWRFGLNQSADEEEAEIRRAMGDGLGEIYLSLQRVVLGRRRLRG